MPRDKDPQAEKRRDYRKQSRILSGESRHSERRNRPRRRAATHRAVRRAVHQTLGTVVGAVAPEEEEELQGQVEQVRLPSFMIWGPVTLRQHVDDRKRYRAAEAGRVYFREAYDSARHRQSFARFLEAVVSGGVAPSEELAARLLELLEPRRRGRHGSQFLHHFLEDEPGWRWRLRSWIAKTLGHPG